MEQSLKWVLPTPHAPALSCSPWSRLSQRGAHAHRRQTAGRTGPAAPRPGCSCAHRPPGLCPNRLALPAPPRCPPLHARVSLYPREDANLVGPDPIPPMIPLRLHHLPAGPVGGQGPGTGGRGPSRPLSSNLPRGWPCLPVSSGSSGPATATDPPCGPGSPASDA